MAQKALKKKTLDSPRSTVSEGHKHRKGLSWIFPMKKFITLPDGLRVKSRDSEAVLKKATPLRAVPLSTGGVQVEILNGQQQSPTLEGNNTAPALTRTATHDSLIHSSPGKGKPKYIKRSRSSPSDLGRQKLTGHKGVYHIHSLEQQDWFEDEDTDLAHFSQIDLNGSLTSSNSTDHSNVVSPTSRDKPHTHEYIDIPGGQKYVTHSNYASSTLNSRVSRSLNELNSMETQRIPAKVYSNGTLPRGLLVYQPNSEMTILKDTPQTGVGPVHQNGYDTAGQASLLKSRAHFSSMPSLLRKNSNYKEERKILKELKRREKEERKIREKEEKRRAKEEKRRRKAEKYFNQSLPRNWGYLNKPIESVYMRPKLTLSAVPIDIEDGAPSPRPINIIPAAPTGPAPMPPQPSLKTRSVYSSAPDLLRVEQVYGATLRGAPKRVVKDATAASKGVARKMAPSSPKR